MQATLSCLDHYCDIQFDVHKLIKLERFLKQLERYTTTVTPRPTDNDIVTILVFLMDAESSADLLWKQDKKVEAYIGLFYKIQSVQLMLESLYGPGRTLPRIISSSFVRLQSKMDAWKAELVKNKRTANELKDPTFNHSRFFVKKTKTNDDCSNCTFLNKFFCF